MKHKSVGMRKESARLRSDLPKEMSSELAEVVVLLLTEDILMTMYHFFCIYVDVRRFF